MTILSGKKVLLVEDEFLIADLAGEMLAELGASVVGPATSIPAALALVESEVFDAALLDVNLNGQKSEPVAAALAARGVPFVILTGYGAVGWAGEAPVLGKPYTRDQLRDRLVRALQA